MKNSIISFALAFFVLMASASAMGELTANQSVVYFSAANDAYDTAGKFISSDGTFMVQNTLNTTLTVSFANTEMELDGDNILNLTNQILTFGPNETKTITLQTDSLRNLESGEYNTMRAGHKFELVNDSNPTQVFADLDVRALVPAVRITKITLTDKATGDTISHIEKGEDVTVTVKYENNADQTDLENINVQVGIYDGKKDKLKTLTENLDGDTLQDDEDVSDLNSGRSDEVSFDFTMPYDMSDGQDFTALAEVTADSRDTSARFYDQDVKEFSANVPNDRLAITKFTATPAVLDCSDNNVRISTTIQNIGDSREDVQLFLRNPETNFEKVLNDKQEIRIDNDFTDESSFTEDYSELVNLADMKPGKTYTYTLVASYNNNADTEEAYFKISQDSCAPVQNTTTTTQPTVVVTPTQPTTTTQPTTPNVPVSNTPYVTLKDVSGSGFSSDLVVPIAVGIGGLLVGAIIVMLLIPRP